ncbi:polysaccharide deacetylase family protein [Fodinibius sp.]|uniref:polysaccharide deacetylase family protein n=1 Tax=Fodinibius sp. TaxID=1872440 RepID=UPI00356A280B
MNYLLTSSIVMFLLFAGISTPLQAQPDTYAEKLGYPEEAKVLIMHVDDAGMSWGSNKGTRDAIEKGVANSFSIMMPCPWVPGIAKYVKEHPRSDAGLHLTLTSEWDDYRWGPLMGKPAVPGLVDREGCFWGSVDQVVEHASPDEVEAEIRAQVERALTMGFRPTHLDSHMGTLFADRAFLERYIKVGADYKIPVMFPGGHMSFLKEDYRQETIRELKESGQWEEGMEVPTPDLLDLAPEMGQNIWSMGLPVLDDLHNVSYGWEYPGDDNPTDEQLQQFYTEKYIETMDELEPGLTMVIMHCTDPSEIFGDISTSGLRRKGDLLAMTDPALKQYLEEENIILATWREVMERREKVN